jgi:hypothetical protein
VVCRFGDRQQVSFCSNAAMDILLQVTGHPEYGLPVGLDRIVPIFLATLAVRQQSQTIRFKSGAEMLDTFGMNKGGKEYRRLVAAFERIFGATIFLQLIIS